jgi:hypothetical protein
LIFVGVAWRRFIDSPGYTGEIGDGDQHLQRLVTLILEVVVLEDPTDDVGLDDIKAVARRSLHLGISATPAAEFVASILTMSRSPDTAVSLP